MNGEKRAQKGTIDDLWYKIRRFFSTVSLWKFLNFIIEVADKKLYLKGTTENANNSS